MKSLLDKARTSKTKLTDRKWTKQHYELVIAYLKGEISVVQVAKALELQAGVAPHYINYILREGIKKEAIVIRIKA